MLLFLYTCTSWNSIYAFSIYSIFWMMIDKKTDIGCHSLHIYSSLTLTCINCQNVQPEMLYWLFCISSGKDSTFHISISCEAWAVAKKDTISRKMACTTVFFLFIKFLLWHLAKEYLLSIFHLGIQEKYPVY